MNNQPPNCKFYGSTIGCRYGNNCRYSHLNPNCVPFCYYYNNCRFGINCKFRHINFSSNVNINACNTPAFITYAAQSNPAHLNMVQPIYSNNNINRSPLKTDQSHKMKSIKHESNQLIMNELKQNDILQLNDNSIHSPSYDYLYDECLINACNPCSDCHTLNQGKSRCGSLSRCDSFHRFINIMQRYNEYGHCDVKNANLVNDFLHLLQNHNNDEAFESIFNILGYCDIANCAKFGRNYRNRQHLIDKTDNYPPIVNAWNAIMDKMHCYYQHCYDIGNRLLIKERVMINTNGCYQKNENVYGDDHESFEKQMINKTLIKINQILSSKRKIYKNANPNIDNRINQKYNQLFIEQSIADRKMYHFGFKFKYGYKEENHFGWGWIDILPKYSSLKEELCTNDICTISMNQFDTEYEKALIHFNDDYCKQNFSSQSFCINIDYLLSLMIYCNYTELQYQFSKTYRDNNGKNHNNFYFWGKSLKIAVKKFGTKIRDGDINAFYHGIGQQLLFPQYVGVDGRGIFISCPLSTSSSVSVAANFTNDNNGLIIQLGDEHELQSVKYFSVSWLSDYGNESEYLFIQNQRMLEIHNIFDAKVGYEYGNILNALKIIEDAICGIVDNQRIVSHQTIINKIINKQLHQSLSSSEEYVDKLIEIYFHNKTSVSISYSTMKTSKMMFDLFCCSKYKWIKMKQIDLLFPNVETIHIFDATLCRLTFEDIFSHLANKKMLSQLVLIEIRATNKNDVDIKLNASWLASNYKSRFGEIGYHMRGHDKYNWIRIYKKGIWKQTAKNEITTTTKNKTIALKIRPWYEIITYNFSMFI